MWDDRSVAIWGSYGAAVLAMIVALIGARWLLRSFSGREAGSPQVSAVGSPRASLTGTPRLTDEQGGPTPKPTPPSTARRAST